MDLQSTFVLSALEQPVSGSTVRRAVVSAILENGDVCVTVPGDEPLRVVCDVLCVAAESTLVLVPGTTVLVLLPTSEEDRGCVLGVVGAYAPKQESTHEPRRVVIAAQEELSLQCGQSSLELRGDGRILLKGIDVVTRAKRTHKIKAGTVAIN